MWSLMLIWVCYVVHNFDFVVTVWRSGVLSPAEKVFIVVGRAVRVIESDQRSREATVL